MATSHSRSLRRAVRKISFQFWKIWTLQNSGSGRSRLEAYHSRSCSKNSIEWPRLLRARARARNVVAWPFPHDDVIERPKMTIFTARAPWSRRDGRRSYDRCTNARGWSVASVSSAQNLVHFAGSQRVRMIPQSALSHSRPNPPRFSRVDAAQQLNDVLGGGGNQNLSCGSKERFNAGPRVGNEAGAGARCFEHP